MKKTTRLLLITLLVIFCSCESYTTSSIINSSERNLYLEIQYDKDTIEKYLGIKIQNDEDTIKKFLGGTSPFITLFVEENTQKSKFIKVDSLNCLIDIKITPKDTFEICVNRGSEPIFEYIKNIKIFGKDTILLQNREEMQKVFQKERTGKFELIIK
ncbi:hypothetical protein [Flavobacterium sp. WC2509]|uniref:hypothetical protein n=1 Tax=Flavobacterium sp. WC2509 TaxID=3461406 RepID=UPI004044ECA5